MNKQLFTTLKSVFSDNRGYFITGSDTNVGKTYCAALLQKALDAVYFKPIQSGDLEAGGDRTTVQKLNDMPDHKFIQSIYTFSRPLSPNQSAYYEGVTIDFDKITLPTGLSCPIIVEGAGGVLVPLNDRYFMIDVIKKFNLPVILVVRSGLGTLNHTLLTLEALRVRNISIAGILFNQAEHHDNYLSLQKLSGVEHIIKIPKQQ